MSKKFRYQILFSLALQHGTLRPPYFSGTCSSAAETCHHDISPPPTFPLHNEDKDENERKCRNCPFLQRFSLPKPRRGRLTATRVSAVGKRNQSPCLRCVCTWHIQHLHVKAELVGPICSTLITASNWTRPATRFTLEPHHERAVGH